MSKCGTPVSTIVENKLGFGVNFAPRQPAPAAAAVFQRQSAGGPKIPDSALTPEELFRRNRIRQRNKEAAQRVRQRRAEKIKNLEAKVETLEVEKAALIEENRIFKEKLENGEIQSPNFNRQISNTDSPQDELEYVFEPMKTDIPELEIYVNGIGKGALLVNAETAFLLTPIGQNIQLTTCTSPQRANSILHLNTILNSL